MPTIYLVLACALWGLSFPLIKAIQLEQVARLDDAGSTFLAAWLQFARFSLATLVMLPMLIGKPRIRRLEWRQGIFLGFWGGLGMGLQAWGLGHTEASTSAFLTQAYCVILPAVACIQARRRPSPRTVAATVLVLVGGAILAGVSQNQFRLGMGETATLAAAGAFTGQILILDHPRYQENRALPVTVIMCSVTSIGYLPVSFLTASQPHHLITAGGSWTAVVCLLSLVVLSTMGAYLLMNTFQPKVSATEAGLIYTTEPVFTAGFALFLPGIIASIASIDYSNESLNARMLIGGGFIVAANAVMQLRSKPHSPSVAPAP